MNYRATVLGSVVVLGISAQALTTRLPALDPIEGATVLVGAVSASPGATFGTFGTGFIVADRNRVYVVTCRHVILEAHSTNLYAIPRPKKTWVVPTLIKLGDPIYHPRDATTGTYDVAVVEIVGSTLNRLLALGVTPIEIRSSGAEELPDGLAVVAAGYPVEYAKRELSLGRAEPLLPLRLAGTVKHVPLDALAQNGFGGKLREGYLAQTGGPPLGKGASGGAVYVGQGGGAIEVVGVLLASADLQINDNGRVWRVQGFVFASSLRIMKTLRQR
jgi:Trypsin-like peptidase domain